MTHLRTSRLPRASTIFVDMARIVGGKWEPAVVAAALTAFATIAAVAASMVWRSWKRMISRIQELEASLKYFSDKAASERRGRTRAQQELRKALLPQHYGGNSLRTLHSSSVSYPLTPIAVVESCFSTRNGTPRQPLLVPLARACVVIDVSSVPPSSLEGLDEYSHCWILYVFHLNTDLEKLWKHPSRSKLKAKVRVPRLKGGKVGVLATRSPHRPCPIGLTLAKVEAVDGCTVLLSGVDLVDGTPVLDIKPYLPYSDCIQTASVPKWLEGNDPLVVASVCFSSKFESSFADCWEIVGKHSLYASPAEFCILVEQALSWDIRSISQQSRPHCTIQKDHRDDLMKTSEDVSDGKNEDYFVGASSSSSPGDIKYHIVLEGINISYRIDMKSNIVVEEATLSSIPNVNRKQRSGYLCWRNKLIS